MAKKSMTDQIFFDTDCLSAFLWVGKENILVQLYKNRIAVPQQVYDEIVKVPHLKRKTDVLITSKDIMTSRIILGTPEADLYIKLTTNPGIDNKIIGKGEASAISLAKYYDGILASNNMRDISPYIELYKLRHITTGNIMVEALNKGLILEGEGNVIWADMIHRQRKLPTLSFSDFLTSKFNKLS
jgi:predicted nucleic acid-binding protein